jgi:diguanylate cyclase (GGDEF)-like protein
MQAIWKDIYPSIKSAVNYLDSIESLLEQTLSVIQKIYQVDCLLIFGFETGQLNALTVYAASQDWQTFANHPDYAALQGLEPVNYSVTAIRQFKLNQLPDWLAAQQRSPQLTQLPTGELIIPITSKPTHKPSVAARSSAEPLQLVLQLRPHAASIDAASLEALEVVCSQLGLAYSALSWRLRLEHSRQQSALVGRIAQLLNSNLNPDKIVELIVAELGQGLHSDRCILVDLRHDPVDILAVWDQPDLGLRPLVEREIPRSLWQDAVEMFLQGGASYLEVQCIDSEPDALQSWLGEIGATSVLMIPLFLQSDFFGTIGLLDYMPRSSYQLDELQIVRQVADHAAIALATAQHFPTLWHKETQRSQYQTSSQRSHHRDELTQLPNRHSLERELNQLSAKAVWAVQPIFSIMICDIDYFKIVNDTYGHLVGDEVLQRLAQRLQKQLRRDTPLYRYGGEEFVAILAETKWQEATDVAERLRQEILASPIETSAGAIEVTASFGVAQQDTLRDHDAWDVVYRADQALSEAKRQGRDRVRAL